MIGPTGRPVRIALDPAALAAGTAIGLTASTPRSVHERLLPLLGHDLDFARTLRVQLDAARASIQAAAPRPRA